MIRNFLSNSKGNVAAITGIMILPLIAAGGIAIDYSRIVNSRSYLQNAADSAALAAAIESTKSEAERKKIARDMFNSNGSNYKVKDFKVTFSDDSVVVDTSIDLDLTFLRAMGRKFSEVKVQSTANAALQKLEIALVLDVSGSMRASFPNGQTRIDVLKSSVEALIKKFEDVTNAAVSISVVPFTMNVNIGKHNTHMVSGESDDLFDGTEWKGCVFEPKEGGYVSNAPSKKPYAMIWPPMPNGNGSGNMCTRNPSDGTNSGYANLSEVGNSSANSQLDGPNYNCVRHSVLPLTNDLNKVKNHVSSLTSESNQGTIIAPGVTWGLRTLSPEKPFSEGSSWKNGAEKIMIVLTDGSLTTEIEYNTGDMCSTSQNSVETFKFDPSDYGLSGSKITTTGPKDYLSPYGFILDSDPFGTNPSSMADLGRDLDNISTSACAEAKKTRNGEKITVYTIGVSDQTGPGTRTYNVLNNCATSSDNHFFVDDASDLEDTFNEIAKRVLKIRITS